MHGARPQYPDVAVGVMRLDSPESALWSRPPCSSRPPSLVAPICSSYRLRRLGLKRHEFDEKVKFVRDIYESGGAVEVVKLASALDIRLSIDPAPVQKPLTRRVAARVRLPERPRALLPPGPDPDHRVDGAA